MCGKPPSASVVDHEGDGGRLFHSKHPVGDDQAFKQDSPEFLALSERQPERPRCRQRKAITCRAVSPAVSDGGCFFKSSPCNHREDARSAGR